jgi:hypothetical protein
VPNQAKYYGNYFKNMGLVTLIKTFKGLEKCFFFFFYFVMLFKWWSSIHIYLAKFGNIKNVKVKKP